VAVNLELLGSATIVKAGWDYDQKTRWHHGQFRPRDLEAIRRLVSVVQATGFVKKTDQTFVHKQTKIQGQVMGVEPNFFSAVHIVLAEGRPITDEDVASRKPVCVMGSRICTELFGTTQSPLGQKIWMEGVVFSVVGVTGGIEDREYSRSLFIPFTVASDLYFGEPTISGIYVRAVNWQSVAAVRDAVVRVLRKNHPSYGDSLEVTYYPEKISTIHTVESLVKFLLYLGLTLVIVLGGSGIANLMYLAVQERTVEIGLRKAVGATDEVILMQFLLEAVATSFTGVLAGLALGSAIIVVLRVTFSMIPDYSMMIAATLGALVLGIVLGVVPGLEPARKASRLEPAEAMRFE
jgi:putative ABC transport system permease protein